MIRLSFTARLPEAKMLSAPNTRFAKMLSNTKGKWNNLQFNKSARFRKHFSQAKSCKLWVEETEIFNGFTLSFRQSVFLELLLLFRLLSILWSRFLALSPGDPCRLCGKIFWNQSSASSRCSNRLTLILSTIQFLLPHLHTIPISCDRKRSRRRGPGSV